MKYIEIKAYAKINLGLNIVSKRLDGYHNLQTIFYPLTDLYDLLEFNRSDKFEFTCDNLSLMNDNANLVIKAKKMLEKNIGNPIHVSINLHKRIPIGAGLGGGSSDAAATLISLNELFRIGLNYEQLIDIALQLGSDVPFFIKAKPSYGKSRGEILEPLPFEIRYPILIVNPGIHISTKEAFNNITPKENQIDLKEIFSKETIDYNLIREKVTNDFENYVFNKYPEIAEIKRIMYNNNALFALMSGSGSTVFGIFNNVKVAESVIDLLPNNYFCLINNPDH